MIGRLIQILSLATGAVLIAAGIVLAQAPVAPARGDEVAPMVRPTPARTPEAIVDVPTAIPSATPAPKLGDGWRIRVARIGIDLPLREGDTGRDVTLQQTPDGAAYHFAGSALPGTPGNAYVYGHARWAQFIGLWYTHLGDVVVISGPGRTLTYRVSEIHPRVAADDLSYLMPSPDERLTLQTSTGPNPTDPRFVVIALPADR